MKSNSTRKRQLQSTDILFPVKSGVFPFRDAIEYSHTMNMAIPIYASRYRETLLYNRYLMGKNNIEKGQGDNWTLHPAIIKILTRRSGRKMLLMKDRLVHSRVEAEEVCHLNI
ncbi:MAG: hypothetical protein R2744_08705 [Bacteroidales bacterium]